MAKNNINSEPMMNQLKKGAVIGAKAGAVTGAQSYAPGAKVDSGLSTMSKSDVAQKKARDQQDAAQRLYAAAKAGKDISTYNKPSAKETVNRNPGTKARQTLVKGR